MLSFSGRSCLLLPVLTLLLRVSAASPPLLPVLLLPVLIQRVQAASPPLLLFLIDGFRYDYLQDLSSLPGFTQLLREGVTVKYMTPDFPSLSYPNYYSLMTGRYCEVHHMTGNYMWDSDSQKEFLIGVNTDSRLPLWWDGSEPLWVTLQRLGRRVYMYYWPGCEVEILGVRPSFCEEYVYDPTLKNLTDSMENALNVLQSGEASMAAVYYERIDVQGHHFGPESTEVRTAVKQLDGALETLHRKLKEKALTGKVNIVMFSDHGMTPIAWMEKVIELEKYINMSDVEKMMDRGPVVSLWPRPDALDKNKTKLPYWKNGTGPAMGWQHGWHGYDNEFIDMRGFFIASGPDFQRNVVEAPIRSVDVYNLLCKTLGVNPLPNNGSWSRVERLLRSGGPGGPGTTLSSLTSMMILMVPAVLLLGPQGSCF